MDRLFEIVERADGNENIAATGSARLVAKRMRDSPRAEANFSPSGFSPAGRRRSRLDLPGNLTHFGTSRKDFRRCS